MLDCGFGEFCGIGEDKAWGGIEILGLRIVSFFWVVLEILIFFDDFVGILWFCNFRSNFYSDKR